MNVAFSFLVEKEVKMEKSEYDALITEAESSLGEKFFGVERSEAVGRVFMKKFSEMYPDIFNEFENVVGYGVYEFDDSEDRELWQNCHMIIASVNE